MTYEEHLDELVAAAGSSLLGGQHPGPCDSELYGTCLAHSSTSEGRVTRLRVALRAFKKAKEIRQLKSE